MINFMVANLRSNSKRSFTKEAINLTMKIQIENSLDVGWRPEQILLLTNFDFEHVGVKAIQMDGPNSFCLTGSKMFALAWAVNTEIIKEGDSVWSHDLDAWQNCNFEFPEFKDVGIATYSNSKYNGGSIFWKYSAKDIINNIVDTLKEDKAPREEPTINRILKSKEYKDRVTVVNNTFNVGCSGFGPRFERSIKPVRVCHFHPHRGQAWSTFVLDKHNLNEVVLTVRLERLLRKHYPHLR